MNKTFVGVGAAVLITSMLGAQTRPVAPPQTPAPALRPTTIQRPSPAVAHAASAATQRALLDQYCVTCHNDRTRRANLSLEKLDLTTAADHAELWEKVIRKLRAGVMPPPGVRRPPLAE